MSWSSIILVAFISLYIGGVAFWVWRIRKNTKDWEESDWGDEDWWD